MCMVFTNNKTPTKSSPSGYNSVSMLVNKLNRATTQSAPATMKFSDLSGLKKSRGCRSCSGR